MKIGFSRRRHAGLWDHAHTCGLGGGPAGGARWTLFIGQAVAGIFLILMLFADAFMAVMVIMFGARLGLGFISPSCVLGIVTWFPLKERAMAMGLNNMSINAGG